MSSSAMWRSCAPTPGRSRRARCGSCTRPRPAERVYSRPVAPRTLKTIYGEAVILDDPQLPAPCAVNGKVPRLGILVSVREAYTHCSKAMIRSELWNPERHIDRAELPRHGDILRSISLPDLDVEAHERDR